MLGSVATHGLSLTASWGYSLVVVYGPLISVASLNEEYRLYEQGFQLLWIVGLVVADGRL